MTRSDHLLDYDYDNDNRFADNDRFPIPTDSSLARCGASRAMAM
ncbi:MAG TPA: hypothetical protein VJ910_14895 [Desulfuromonadales bacterium]|nr:hypothetical protein [Desulfuromonadales bacterium]